MNYLLLFLCIPSFAAIVPFDGGGGYTRDDYKWYLGNTGSNSPLYLNGVLQSVDAGGTADLNLGAMRSASTVIGLVDSGYAAGTVSATNTGWGTDMTDPTGHGTKMLGVIQSVLTNSVVIFAKQSFRSSLETSNSIRWCVDNGARVICFAGGFSPPNTNGLFEACYYAYTHDVILVCAVPDAAVDEDGQQDYPIAWRLPNVIAVTSTTRTDTLYDAAAWGAQTVDLGAPGRVIVTTGLTGPCYTSGTSFAAAMVAAAVALLRDAYPNQHHPAIKERLLRSVKPIPDLAGRSTSGGRLDVSAALRPEAITIGLTNGTLFATGLLLETVYEWKISADLVYWESDYVCVSNWVYRPDMTLTNRYFRLKVY